MVFPSTSVVGKLNFDLSTTPTTSPSTVPDRPVTTSSNSSSSRANPAVTGTADSHRRSSLSRQLFNSNKTSPPTSPSSSIIVNPFAVSSTAVDQSLLKLCQEGDAGALSRYLSYHHDKVPARTLNATDLSGKVHLAIIFFLLFLNGSLQSDPSLT